jgi:hypothetical protein
VLERNQKPFTGMSGRLGRPGVEGPGSEATLVLVLIVNVVVTGAFPVGVTVCGLNEQLTPAGWPEQAKLTGFEKPAVGVILRLKLADWPATTLALAELEAMLKSGGCEFTV